MGSADIVPGVSGGTIALITGIYEKLVYSISKINFKFLKPLVKLNFKEFWHVFCDEIDFKFFIPLGLGIGVAMLSLAKVITYCMETYTAFTYAFFLGLILASAIVCFRRIEKINVKHVIFAILGAILAYIFVSLNPIAANHSLPVLFISGMIAICAMILPGISGSFMLLLLGQYEYMLNALHNLNFSEIITFCVGALIGILGFSKILNYLLKSHEEITMAFLIGVMVGTLKLPALAIATSLTSFTLVSILPCVIFAIIGLVLIIALKSQFNKKS
ncbi:MAG: DUF368 domain-containing protein [archaeon]|nr:DUF368 domain-containing protein [archaeon]